MKTLILILVLAFCIAAIWLALGWVIVYGYWPFNI